MPVPGNSVSERHAPQPNPFNGSVQVVTHPTARLTGGGYVAIVDGRAFVVVDPDVSGPLRQWVIAHETAHLRRGVSAYTPDQPPQWQAVIAREEQLVDREAAGSLIGTDELSAAVEALVTAGEPVTPKAVAAAMEVAEPVARIALDQLRRRRQRQRRVVPPQTEAVPDIDP